MITLATLPNKSKQEVFNHIALHLLKQNARSLRRPNSTACAYRSYDGLRCAAGCVISGLEYNNEFEGKSWLGLVGAGKVPKNHAILISDFQKMHDGEIPANWPDEIKDIAKKHNLSYQVVEDFFNDQTKTVD